MKSECDNLWVLLEILYKVFSNEFFELRDAELFFFLKQATEIIIGIINDESSYNVIFEKIFN